MTWNLHTPRCQDHALSLPRLYLSVSDTEGDQDGASFEVTSTQKQVNVGYYNTVPTWWFKVTFLGWLSDPFKGLSDLQLGDEKVTLNHLVVVYGIQKNHYKELSITGYLWYIGNITTI